jgi:putative tricarboxylic transport membrane protein
MKHWTRGIGIAAIAGFAFAVGGTVTFAQDAYPAKDTEWIVPFAPGSGGDVLARTVIQIMTQYKMYPHNMIVTNIEGASGSKGYTTLLQRAGDPYVLSVTSSSFITGPLTSDTPWKATDFTPVALVGRDDYVMAVNKGSATDTFAKFVEAGQTKRMKIGIVSLVTAGYIVGTQLAKAANYEWDAVPFTDNGQMFSALFSGSIDALITNPGEVAGQLEVGDMIGLGVSSEKPLEGTAYTNVPTFASLGYKTTAALPRGIIMAPNAPKEAQDWWANALREVVSKPEWQDFLRKNGTSSTQLFGDDWGAYYTELSADFESALREAGAIE